MGRQTLVVGLNFVGFWLIGLPVGASLTFKAGLGVAGLWWGLFAGLTSVATIGIAALARTDWDLESRQALTRIGTSAEKSTSSTVDASVEDVDASVEEVDAETPTDNIRLPHKVA